jgi:hypothetical protein
MPAATRTITTADARKAFFALFPSTGNAMAFQRKLMMSVGLENLPPCAKAVIEDPDADRLPFYQWMVSEHAADIHDHRMTNT